MATTVRTIGLGIAITIGLVARGTHAAPDVSHAADVTQIDHVLHQAIDCTAGCYNTFLQGLAPLMILPSGELYDLSGKNRPADGLFGEPIGDVTAQKLGKVTIGLARETADLAYFQAPLSYTIPPAARRGRSGEMRVSGIVKRYKTGWGIAAIAFADVVPDAELIARAKKANVPMPKGAPAITSDDPKTADFITYWFTNGFGADNDDNPTAIASGTSSTEYQTGKNARPLAATWDKLKIVPTLIDVHTFDIYLQIARVKVMMPIKGSTAGVPLALTVIISTDTTYWAWDSMQYSAALPAQ